MKKELHKAQERGYANHGWLKSYHSFNFASFYSPERKGFGLLRVLNDDTVSGGEGFGEHPHSNMEIISIPLEGVLAHKDSIGTKRTLTPGEIQVMSAGSGITHSEFNNWQDQEVKFLQIWIFPDQNNVPPRYNQKAFDESIFNGRLAMVAGGIKTQGDILHIHQNAGLYLGKFYAEKEISFTPEYEGNGIYIFVIEGSAEAAGEKLSKRDALGIWDFDTLQIKVDENSHILIIEVPMQA